MSQPTTRTLPEELHAVVDHLAEVMASRSITFLPADGQADVLLTLHRLATSAHAALLEAMLDADTLVEETGHRDVASWLAHASNQDAQKCGAELKLARGLAAHPGLAEALRTAQTTPEHARAALRAFDQLPPDLDAPTRASVESTMADLVREHTPKVVGHLGQRVFELVAPAEADAHEQRLLEAQEERAWETCRLDLIERGDGTTRISGVLPATAGAVLRKALDALTSPRVMSHERTSPGRRRGLAFATLIEHLPTDGLPTHGGTPISLVATIEEQRLSGMLRGAGLLDTDDRISAAEARRLACGHGVLPLVLGGESVPLDHGRAKRLFTRHQITTARATHSTCQADGCTTPSAWCEAHHQDAWSNGGATDQTNLVLLCSRHHHRAHHTHWRPTYQPDGAVSFRRRC